MVDEAQSDTATVTMVDAVPRPMYTRVLVAFDEGVHRVAVRRHGRVCDHAALVLASRRLAHAARAPTRGRLERCGGIVHAQRDRLHPVAVLAHVLGDVALRSHRRGEHQADLALLQHVRRSIAHTRLRTGIRDDVEAERVAVVVRGLSRVAHIQLDVVGAGEHGHVDLTHGVDHDLILRFDLEHGLQLDGGSQRQLRHAHRGARVRAAFCAEDVDDQV